MANKEIHIGDYVISETSRPYMIAEIGINHNGDINIAKKLMDAANARLEQCEVPEAYTGTGSSGSTEKRSKVNPMGGYDIFGIQVQSRV